MNRRRLGQGALALGLSSLAAPALRAQGFDHTIRLVVPNAPGGTSDILARLIAPELTRALGQNVVVENRAGAGGNIGADAVAKSPPDGHTLLLMDVTTLATNPALFPRLPFDNQRDLAPVTMLIYAPYVLGVATGCRCSDAAGLAAFAKSAPQPLNAGNSGVGTASHLTAHPARRLLRAGDDARALPRRRPGAHRRGVGGGRPDDRRRHPGPGLRHQRADARAWPSPARTAWPPCRTCRPSGRWAGPRWTPAPGRA